MFYQCPPLLQEAVRLNEQAIALALMKDHCDPTNAAIERFTDALKLLKQFLSGTPKHQNLFQSNDLSPRFIIGTHSLGEYLLKDDTNQGQDFVLFKNLLSFQPQEDIQALTGSEIQLCCGTVLFNLAITYHQSYMVCSSSPDGTNQTPNPGYLSPRATLKKANRLYDMIPELLADCHHNLLLLVQLVAMNNRTHLHLQQGQWVQAQLGFAAVARLAEQIPNTNLEPQEFLCDDEESHDVATSSSSLGLIQDINIRGMLLNAAATLGQITAPAA